MKNLKITLFIFFIFFTLLSCDTDPGLEPTQSGFRGKIKFINDWPENTDQVLVVASTVFPPANITDIILGDPLPLDVDSTDYIIYTPPAHFAAIGVVWKEINQPWDVTNIIGIYFPTKNKFTPGSVTIPDKQSVIDSINIVADLSKAKRAVNSKITGTLRVKGEWPAGATTVLVVASQPGFPTGLLDLTLGQPIQAGFDSTSYSLTLQPGNYKLIGALVLIEGEDLGITSIRGLYYIDPEAGKTGSVTINTDTSVVNNIDIDLVFK